MKKNAFYTLLALLLWTVAIGQTPQMVAFDEIRQIADRNAQDRKSTRLNSSH